MSLILLQEKPYEYLTHGGRKTYRSFSIWLNGICMRQYHENSVASGYAKGQYFDDMIKRDVDLFEKATGFRVTKARVK